MKTMKYRTLITLSFALLFLLQANLVFSASLAEDYIIDEAGRKIKVSQPFTRIISLYGAHTENIYALGGEKKLVAVSTHETFPPGVQNKPSISYHEGLERFLSFRPDLVLLRPMIDQGYNHLVSGLERSGVVVISLQPRTVKEIYTYWQILGRLIGSESQAKEMVSSFQKAINLCQSLNKSINDKKKVYFEAIHNQMKTFSPQSTAIFALKTAGGINIAKEARALHDSNIAAFGKERILSHAAEIDVYLAQKGPMNQPSLDTIRHEPGFEIIKAIRDNNIALINEQLISRPTMRLLQGIYRIGHILYPSIYNKQVQKRMSKKIKANTYINLSKNNSQ